MPRLFLSLHEILFPVYTADRTGVPVWGQLGSGCQGEAELEIVVELGNLVPRNNLALQKVFVDLRYSRSKTTKCF